MSHTSLKTMAEPCQASSTKGMMKSTKKKEDLLDQTAPPALWRASDFHLWGEWYDHDTASPTINSTHYLSGPGHPAAAHNHRTSIRSRR
jgi:hypothetical protein